MKRFLATFSKEIVSEALPLSEPTLRRDLIVVAQPRSLVDITADIRRFNDETERALLTAVASRSKLARA
jgi:hypothetical protein